MKYPVSITAMMIAATVATASTLWSCGKVKTQSDRVVTVKSGDSSSEEDFKSMAYIYDAFSTPGKGFAPGELQNIAMKLKTRLEAMLGVSNIPVEEVMEALVQLYPGMAEGVTPRAILDGLKRNLPLMQWFDGKKEISIEELTAKANEQFSESSAVARHGLLSVLTKFDKSWAGGNENGMISNKELAFPILIMSVMMKGDYSKGLPLEFEGTTQEELTVHQIKAKLNQQIFARYGQKSQAELDCHNLKVEAMQLSLRFYLTNMLVKTKGFGKSIFPAGQREAIEALTGLSVPEVLGTEDQEAQPEELVQLYDSWMSGGDEEGSLNVFELFMLTTDLNFAHQFNAVNIGAIPVNIGNLKDIFPRVADDMFTTDLTSKKSKYTWKNIMSFDRKARGGNNDGKISDAERTVSFAYVRVLDMMYELYDVNHDAQINRTEARPIFKKLGFAKTEIGIERVMDAFFSDVGLSNPNGANFWTGLKLIFKHSVTLDSLSPSEFYVRMSKVLPTVLAKPKPDDLPPADTDESKTDDSDDVDDGDKRQRKGRRDKGNPTG